MDFYSWDTPIRAALFGMIFLTSLFAVLWVWYDTSAAISNRGWSWRLGGSLLVVGTLPAVVVGAANLDRDQERLLTFLGWTAIGCGTAAALSVVTYAVWGRSVQLAFREDDDWAAGRDGDLTIPAGRGPAADPGLTLPGSPRGGAAPSAQADAYFFVKAGPDKGKQFPLADLVTIGRGPGCAIMLSDRRVSGEHAQVKREAGNYVFLDLRSSNGSFLVVEGDDRPLRSAQTLLHGDEIRLGHTLLEFIDTSTGSRR